MQELIKKTWIYGALTLVTGFAWLASKNFTPVTSLLTKLQESQSTQILVPPTEPSPIPSDLLDPSTSPLPHFQVNVRREDDD